MPDKLSLKYSLYVAELLFSKGHEVQEAIRRAGIFNTQRIDQIYKEPDPPSAKLLVRHRDLSSCS